jgi:phytoene dehydrogenase-like protein
MWSYVEQNFGVWTVPGGLGSLAATLTKRLTERKVTVQLGTTVHDLRLHGGRAVGVETDHGSLPADVVVCAVDPRALPSLALHVARTTPAMPPPVCHLGLSGVVPDLAHEVVLHGDPVLVLRTGGSAPAGGAAWTVLARGRRVDDVVQELADRGIDVRRQVQVRVDRSPRDQVEELAGSPYGGRWQRRRTLDGLLAGSPVAGVHLAGVRATVGAALPLVGLTAAVVAERVGPAP